MRGVPIDGGPRTKGHVRLLTEAERSSSPGPPRRDPHTGFYRAEEARDDSIFFPRGGYGVFDCLDDKFVVTGLHSYMHARQVAREMNGQRPLD